MLSALFDGRALPAGELARIAGVSPQTASAHLDRLLAGNLVRLEAQGRHRYYRLSGFAVADLLESLASVAQPRPLTRRSDPLALGRTCYGHLAGRLGVSITDALRGHELIDADLFPTNSGRSWFEQMGVDVATLKRRPLARPCLDWSERRHHLAGALGVAFTTRLFELGWVARGREGRSVRLSVEGRKGLESELDLAFDF
jgi:DNA-binding transcriptional ArsR family regulator